MTLQKDLVSYMQHHTSDLLLTLYGGKRTCGWAKHHNLQQHNSISFSDSSKVETTFQKMGINWKEGDISCKEIRNNMFEVSSHSSYKK